MYWIVLAFRIKEFLISALLTSCCLHSFQCFTKRDLGFFVQFDLCYSWNWQGNWLVPGKVCKHVNETAQNKQKSTFIIRQVYSSKTQCHSFRRRTKQNLFFNETLEILTPSLLQSKWRSDFCFAVTMESHVQIGNWRYRLPTWNA